MQTPVPILIIGPSGVGKNAVIDRVLPMFANLQPFKTTTSRLPRPGEDKYHYVSPAVFQELIDSDAFLEWEETHGNRYGTQRRHIDEVIELGKYPVPLSAVDVRGAKSYLKTYPGTLVIFLAFESLQDLPARLRRTRPETSEQEIATRLATAEREMAAATDFDHIVVNREGELDNTVDQVARIIENELGLHRTPKGGA